MPCHDFVMPSQIPLQSADKSELINRSRDAAMYLKSISLSVEDYGVQNAYASSKNAQGGGENSGGLCTDAILENACGTRGFLGRLMHYNRSQRLLDQTEFFFSFPLHAVENSSVFRSFPLVLMRSLLFNHFYLAPATRI